MAQAQAGADGGSSDGGGGGGGGSPSRQVLASAARRALLAAATAAPLAMTSARLASGSAPRLVTVSRARATSPAYSPPGSPSGEAASAGMAWMTENSRRRCGG